MHFLTDEERAVQAAIRQFAQQEIAPQAAAIDEADRFPADLIAQMGRLGWLGLTVPAEFGGGGAGTLAYLLAIEEVARASAAVATILTVHSTLGAYPIATWGTDEQRRRFLPRMATGELLGAYALTEPDAGSDAAAQRTRAVRDGDSYVLNGRKAFVSNGDVAGVTLVFASTDPSQRSRGISAFLVERGTPGMLPGAPMKKLGLHGSPTVQIAFEDCRVPAANRLGAEGEGFKIAMQVLDLGRCGIAAQAAGIAQAALDLAVAYVTGREQFGRPIGAFQGLRFKLADVHTRLSAARLLTYHAARLRDAGQPFSLEAATAKLHASATAVFAADTAVQVHGGYGYMREVPAERLLRDAKITEIYEGTSEIQRVVIARHLLPGVREA